MLLSYVFFIEWMKLYPHDYDPKNVEYVLWKHGLNQNMNLDHALGGMTHDTWAVKLVLGKTKEQLTERFGTIRTYDHTTSTAPISLTLSANWVFMLKEKKS